MKKSVYEEKYVNSPNSDYIHARRMEAISKWTIAKANEDIDDSVSLLDIMEAFYPDETEMIDLEKLRVEENKQIYDEWQNSGDSRSFTEYASKEYGFNDADDLSLVASTSEKTGNISK